MTPRFLAAIAMVLTAANGVMSARRAGAFIGVFVMMLSVTSCAPRRPNSSDVHDAVRAMHLVASTCPGGKYTNNEPLTSALQQSGYIDGPTLLPAGQTAVTNQEISTSDGPNGLCVKVRLANFEPTATTDVDSGARFVDVPVSVAFTGLGAAYEQASSTYPDPRFSSLQGQYLATFAASNSFEIKISDIAQAPSVALRLFVSTKGTGFVEMPRDDQIKKACSDVQAPEVKNCVQQVFQDNGLAPGVL